ncbi:heme peroxidase family protein [Ancylobacter sp. A5.8]|uniref:peroxidase family protein n=1 Tax=Ancylobacter gelatini TaxID=2919920 RepID=UPI001F4EB68D|nr:heme peroxidase family protein [Ancylobacter gelatini]MCJ8142718.1 heme peroxidase family protein [Ancylobacter gelatini]
MKRHSRDNFFIVGEGIATHDTHHQPVTLPASTEAEMRKFRFSRLGPKGGLGSPALLAALARAMVAGPQQNARPTIPAGFTYLGQFIDHDLTFDRTAAKLGDNVLVADLVQGRSPALDLDCLYGGGPNDPDSRAFYVDGIRFRMGRTAADANFAGTNVDREGFDLPRSGFGSSKSARRKAAIADPRNDENLIVAQFHLAMLRFHNRVVDRLAGEGTPSAVLFERAREVVVRHYQWIVQHEFLPLIVDQAILDDVAQNGRRFFEPNPLPGDFPTMPIEFSVAAYRTGHSMIRGGYQWNRIFNSAGIPATLGLLFLFSGTSGTLSADSTPGDPESGSFERLPTSWIADFRRLFDFAAAGRPDLALDAAQFNVTRRIDTSLVDPLATLPPGSFGHEPIADPIELNLAFRNLARANMVELASGQQMAAFFGLPPLSADALLVGSEGADLTGLPSAEKDELLAATPLWFYVLREAELNGGKLTGVGGRIVAEVFHRAAEASTVSNLRMVGWQPSLVEAGKVFGIADLLLFAFEGREDLLNPLGDIAPPAPVPGPTN